MKLPFAARTYTAAALPALIPLAGSLRLDLATLAQMLAVGGISLGALLFQRRADKTAHARAIQSDTRARAAHLLRDYERDGRGWFWETDRQGYLRYITHQVAERIGLSPDDILGKPFTSLIAQIGTRDEEREERTLGFHLSSRTSFSELSIKVGKDEQRWWSVSGNPVLDDLGNFQGFRGSGTDLTDMRETQEAFQQLARYDTLTGLANRLEINRLLEQSLKDHMGKNKPCTLFLLDLDRFKQVNDTLGHPAGDALLKQVAERLERVVGGTGSVGRIGGDEFQIILPKWSDRTALETLARRIIEALSIPYIVEGAQVRIGASIGIVVYTDGPVSQAALVRSADLALYAAKDAGRGTFRFYETSMHELASERRTLEEDLREALARGQLSLVYQPIIEIATEQISGFEVLTRWDHPTRGRIGPDVFITIAEEANLISRIGDWTIRSACEQMAQWPGHLTVAVNVSPTQFAASDLTAVVVNALAQSGIDCSRLELEVTESVFLEGGDDNIAIFNRLKSIGVRLALDDFGTGYSALGYLKKIPFDKIKIDQSFVRGAAQKGSMNGAIIASIVGLAGALGMDTTAEGAETHDELALIRQLGCSHVQGYIYGKPMTAEDATALLAEHGGHAVAEGFKANRPPRKRTFRRIGVHNEGYCYAGLIRNVSMLGALIDGLWDVPSGTRFLLELDDGLFLQAQARWSADNQMGVEFDTPLDLNALGDASRFKVITGWREDVTGKPEPVHAPDPFGAPDEWAAIAQDGPARSGAA